MEKLGKKILIVEDEEVLLGALTEKLTNEGFDTISARDGEEGLGTALKEQPDLILLDIIMPRMDGLTMLEKLRQASPWGKDVPVLILTNLSPGDDTLKQVVRDEPAYYLVKTNWTLEEVVVKIKERLGLMVRG